MVSFSTCSKFTDQWYADLWSPSGKWAKISMEFSLSLWVIKFSLDIICLWSNSMFIRIWLQSGRCQYWSRRWPWWWSRGQRQCHWPYPGSCVDSQHLNTIPEQTPVLDTVNDQICDRVSETKFNPCSKWHTSRMMVLTNRTDQSTTEWLLMTFVMTFIKYNTEYDVQQLVRVHSVSSWSHYNVNQCPSKHRHLCVDTKLNICR